MYMHVYLLCCPTYLYAHVQCMLSQYCGSKHVRDSMHLCSQNGHGNAQVLCANTRVGDCCHVCTHACTRRTCSFVCMYSLRTICQNLSCVPAKHCHLTCTVGYSWHATVLYMFAYCTSCPILY